MISGKYQEVFSRTRAPLSRSKIETSLESSFACAIPQPGEQFVVIRVNSNREFLAVLVGPIA